MAIGVKPATDARYSGSTAATISEEMSVNRLVRPRSTTVRPTGRLRPAPSRSRLLRASAPVDWMRYIASDRRSLHGPPTSPIGQGQPVKRSKMFLVIRRLAVFA